MTLISHHTIFAPALRAAATIRSAVRTAAKPACASTVGLRPERTAARKSSICNFSGSPVRFRLRVDDRGTVVEYTCSPGQIIPIPTKFDQAVITRSNPHRLGGPSEPLVRKVS